MANIFDYLNWRGDLDFKQSEFNDVDNLIITRFAYFPFDDIIKENEIATIKELSTRFQNLDFSKVQVLQKEDLDLFPALGNSNRFGQLKVTKYINVIDDEKEKQFSAITVFLPDKTIYVAYRGTDNTLVGWKEDFNLSFKSHLSSQISAKNYLEEVAKKYSGKLRVGGHSKGGNLAVYAASFANEKVKKRIINVYNNDGPGFMDDVTKSKEYLNILNKIHTFIPQSSVIGRLLSHKEKYTIVESTANGIMQHDLYSWQILGKSFVILNQLSDDSEFVDKTIRDWIIDITPETREKFVDIIYDILTKTDAKTLVGLKSNWLRNIKIILKSYSNIDKEDKKMIIEILTLLYNSARKNYKNEGKSKK